MGQGQFFNFKLCNDNYTHKCHHKFIHTFILWAIIAFISGCGDGTMLLEEKLVVDNDNPTVSNREIKVTSHSASAITLSWAKASDNITASSDLKYYIYRSLPDPSYQDFNSKTQVEAGTLLAREDNIAAVTISSGNTAGSSFFFNIIVEDQHGNKTLYSPVGEYFSSSQANFYPFNADSNDVSTVTSNNLAVGGGSPTLTTDRFDRSERAYYFDNTDDYLESASNFGITGTSTRSVSFWMKSDNEAGVGIPLSYGGGALCSNGEAFGLRVDGSNYNFWGYGSDTNLSTTLTNNWEFWVIIYDGTRVYVYKNGSIIIAGGSINAINTTAAKLRLGRSIVTNSGDEATYYGGKLDDIRVFTTNLSASQVSALYTVSRVQ